MCSHWLYLFTIQYSHNHDLKKSVKHYILFFCIWVFEQSSLVWMCQIKFSFGLSSNLELDWTLGHLVMINTWLSSMFCSFLIVNVCTEISRKLTSYFSTKSNSKMRQRPFYIFQLCYRMPYWEHWCRPPYLYLLETTLQCASLVCCDGWRRWCSRLKIWNISTEITSVRQLKLAETPQYKAEARPHQTVDVMQNFTKISFI